MSTEEIKLLRTLAEGTSGGQMPVDRLYPVLQALARQVLELREFWGEDDEPYESDLPSIEIDVLKVTQLDDGDVISGVLKGSDKPVTITREYLPPTNTAGD